jgi:hypothetical protein
MQNVNALSNEIIGARIWTLPESLIPSAEDSGAAPSSHGAISLLNAGGAHADVEITILFGDRDPAGPYRVAVPALRLLRLRFEDFADPEPIPRDAPFAAVIESDEPIVVQPAFPQTSSWIHFLSAASQIQVAR